jgi:hypothetical protein
MWLRMRRGGLVGLGRRESEVVGSRLYVPGVGCEGFVNSFEGNEMLEPM